MNVFGWSPGSTHMSRQRRPVAACVDRLERRCLLTLQVSPITMVAGQNFDGQVATFAAGDVQGSLSDYQATVYWPGSVNLSTYGYIAPSSPSTYVIYSDNSYAKPGTYPINVVLTGANDSSAQASGSVTVTDAPLTTTPAVVTSLRQTLFSGTVASFSTTNPYAVSSDFQAFINWGDGVNTHTPGTITSTGYESFSVEGSNTYQSAGTYPITVTIVSPGGQSTIVNSTATVTAQTLQVNPITMVAGQYFDGQVATFAAGDVQGSLSDYQATVYWPGALNLSTYGSIAPNGSGTYGIYSQNAYAQPGTYTVNVVLTGANNSSAQASGTATVTDAPLTTTPAVVTPLRQTLFSGTVASFSTINSYAVSSNFQAFINWGDGVNTHTPATITSTGYETYSVEGSNNYRDAGTFPITVTIVSPGGQTNLVNSTAIVTALPLSVLPNPVTGNAGEPLSGVTVATFLDPYASDTASDFQATINWGDGTINVGSVVAQANGVYSVVGDHTYAATGGYTVSIQVVRVASDQTASTTTTAQIGSPSPTFAFTGGLASVPANGTYIASGIATTHSPTFSGTSAAYSLIQLFAQPVNVDKQIYLGETMADSNGNWSLPIARLATGTYVITAKVTPPGGYPSEVMALTRNNGTFSIGFSPAKAKSARHHQRSIIAAVPPMTQYQRRGEGLSRRNPDKA
jgi:hypothetical protein